MLTFDLKTNNDLSVTKYYDLFYMIYPWFRNVTIDFND